MILSKKRKAAVYTVVALIVLTLGFIWINSCRTQQQSAESSGETYSTIKTFFDGVFGEGVLPITHAFIRKAAHFAEFFALGAEFALLYIALNKESYKGYLQTLPYGLYVAVIDEGIQILSDRGPEVKDVFIDYAGYLTAIAIFLCVFAVRRAVKKRKNKEKTV